MKYNSRNMLWGQSLSFMGDYCILPALLIMSTYYENKWMTSGVVIARSLPLIIQPFVGHFIDRMDKIKIMVITDIIRAILFSILLVIPLGENPILFISILFLSYFAGIFFNPSRLATMSLLGEDIKIVNILFARYTCVFITVGALLGVLFVYIGNIKLSILLNVITFLISAFFLYNIKIPKTKNRIESITSRELFKGFSHIVNNKYIFNAIYTMFLMALMWGIIYSWFPIIGSKLDEDIGTFLITIAIGIGGLFGSIIVSKIGFNSKKGIILFSLFSIGSLLFFILSPNFLVGFLTAIIFFASMEYGEVIAKVNVQENAESIYQGRIFSVSESIIGISISMGSILINIFTTKIVSIMVVILVLFYLVNSIIIYREKIINE
ncbi:MFS transporter [Staphylococcus ursi]|uniref:MFS transporter n=1 Tax=Staphylococcus sp. MI 10-1553 TaxID=1912064 RepID=UPI0013986519|nr:MFS transporter [Staphylococcus sp. MI 10-1553]QHW36748.1 MFS transporter [Staphylococcus sp. MI 10-1553]